jgi:hypothetical protein
MSWCTSPLFIKRPNYAILGVFCLEEILYLYSLRGTI